MESGYHYGGRHYKLIFSGGHAEHENHKTGTDYLVRSRLIITIIIVLCWWCDDDITVPDKRERDSHGGDQ
jgi:hypothetical protein